MKRAVILALAFAALSVLDAFAGRRSLRIEFTAWDEAQPLGSAACPGSDPHSPDVFWRGIVFSGSWDGTYLVDTYCQDAFEYDPVADPDPTEYLSQAIFPAEEAGLAAKIGLNDDPEATNRVTARRYTFLDGDRFPENPGATSGYQWAFYFFPGDITLVALYGEVPVGLNGFDPFIGAGAETLWSADASGFDGEYFCFAGTSFRGTWDGEPAGSEPLDGCERAVDVFQDGFEPDFGALRRGPASETRDYEE